MIKVLENTYTKNGTLKIEAVTKIDKCFTICQYKTEEPKNIGVSTLFIQRFDCLVLNGHASTRSKMAVFQTYNKNVNILATSISQKHHRNNHLTLFEPKNEIFQSTEKINVSVCFLYTEISAAYMLWLDWKTQTVSIREEPNIFSYPIIY